MKKKYEKLYIKVEEFNVINAISSCGFTISLGGDMGCAEPEENSFLQGIYLTMPEAFTQACEMDFNDLGYTDYCYHTPNGSLVVLTS